MKNDFLCAYYLAFDWSGWVAFIKSKILIMKGISWPVSSDKWKAPLASMYQTKYDSVLWWPTTVTAKPKTSRQKQNTSRQNQKPHGKTKYFTQQKQNSFSFAVGFCFFSQYLVLPWSLWFCREVFGFAVTVVRYSLYTVEGKCGSS